MEKHFALFAKFLPRIGHKTLLDMLNLAQTNRVDFGSIGTRKEDFVDVLEILNFAKKFSEENIDVAYKKMCRALRLCEENDINFIGRDEKNFPIMFIHMPKTEIPVYIFYKGDISIVNDYVNIAVIGTRKPTAYGMKIAERFGEVLAEKKVTVVSGLALGCDTGGHRGCLNKNGKTVAIMANGLANIFPKENSNLAMEIVDSGGCLISEYPPEEVAKKWNFGERDRLQSGLSSGIIVVQAGIKGGTMITVGHAQEQGKIIGTFYNEKSFHHVTPEIQGNIELVKVKKALPLYDINDIDNFLEQCRTKKLKFTDNRCEQLSLNM